MAVEPGQFLALAAMDRNALAVLIGVHEGEAQVGFARIGLGVEGNEPPAGAPGQ